MMLKKKVSKWKQFARHILCYLSRVDAWYMVRRRARDAGIETAIGNHSFRAIGITDYLERGGDINIAKRMAGHSNVKTTELGCWGATELQLQQLGFRVTSPQPLSVL